MWFKLSLTLLLSVSFIWFGLVAPPSQAAETPLPATENSLIGAQDNAHHDEGSGDEFDRLAPQRQTRNTRLDYTVLDAALSGTVIRLGPSTRRHLSKPRQLPATRLKFGHETPYRLEGSRFSYYYLTKEYREQFTEYRKDLIRIANEIDLTRLNRSEQLAFWFNLHNVVIIDEIAKTWPVKRPSTIRIGEDKVPLDEAKLITIKGVDLSLKNIREDIVYRNWDDPRVIYGFHRGDIGSPALQNYAYTRVNVHSVLDYQTWEFVNARRGFNETSKTRNVSKLYKEAERFFFKDFERDIERHLLYYADAPALKDIRSGKPIAVDRYDYVVADLMGGNRPHLQKRHITIGTGLLTDKHVPAEIGRLLKEIDFHYKILRHRNRISKRTVIIEDIETFDEP